MNDSVILSDISEAYRYELNSDEADTPSQVDGVNILARATGPAFFPDAVSRNGVRYSRELWDSVLSSESVVSDLENRTMFGMIGHDHVDVTDKVLRDGDVSHIVTKMWIDEATNLGMAEFLVLNTGSGRNLNTVLRAGSKLSVSTRAVGELSEPDDEGITEPLDYIFKRIDFVIKPGFLDARPELNENLNYDDNPKETPMPGDTEEAIEVATQHPGVRDETSAVEISRLQSELDECKASLAEYQNMGSKESIEESLMRMRHITEAAEAGDSNSGEIGAIVSSSFSSGAKITTVVAAGEAYVGVKLDKSPTLSQVEAFAKKLRAHGRVAEYDGDNYLFKVKKQINEEDMKQDTENKEAESTMSDKDKEELAEFRKLGDSPEEISEALTHANALAMTIRGMRVREFSKKFNISESIVGSLVDANGIAETEDLLTKNKETADAEVAAEQPTDAGDMGPDEDSNSSIAESLSSGLRGLRKPTKSHTDISESLSSKLLRTVTRVK